MSEPLSKTKEQKELCFTHKYSLFKCILSEWSRLQGCSLVITTASGNRPGWLFYKSHSETYFMPCPDPDQIEKNKKMTDGKQLPQYEDSRRLRHLHDSFAGLETSKLHFESVASLLFLFWSCIWILVIIYFGFTLPYDISGFALPSWQLNNPPA